MVFRVFCIFEKIFLKSRPAERKLKVLYPAMDLIFVKAIYLYNLRISGDLREEFQIKTHAASGSEEYEKIS